MRVVNVGLASEAWTLGQRVGIQGHRTTLSERQGWVVSLSDDDGRIGRGLAAPLPGFSDSTMSEVGAALSQTLYSPALLQADFSSVSDITRFMATIDIPSEASHGIEQALVHLLAEHLNLTPDALLGAENTIRYHRLVSNPEQAEDALEDGLKVIKVKVNGSKTDYARLAAICQVANGMCEVLVDANGSIPPSQLKQWSAELNSLGVTIIEQPLAPKEDANLAQTLSETRPLIALDESVRDLRDIDRVANLGVVDFITVKPMLVGGPLVARKMAREAGRLGLRVLLTHCFDGPLAQQAVELAAKAAPSGSVWSVSEPSARGPRAQPKMRHALPNPLKIAAISRPDHVAWRSGGQNIDYRSLADAVGRQAHQLLSLGVRPGQTVAVAVRDGHSGLIVNQAVGWIGAVLAPLDFIKTPRRALTRQLKLLGTQLVVTDHPEAVPNGDWECVTPRHLNQSGARVDAANWPLDAVRVALFTSGSTGTPRVVTLTGEQLMCSTFGSAARLGHHLDDVWLSCLPGHHVGGLSIMLRACWLGITVESHEVFDVETITSRLESGDISMISLVPEMLERLTRGRTTNFHPRLRVVLVGGAALSEALREHCEALGIPLAVSWGMTETASQVATSLPGARGGHLVPLNVAHVSTDHEGFLAITGPIAPEGHWPSSDVGSVDDEGRIQIAGRGDRVIISGGENISLQAIEYCLAACEDISKAVAVGIRDRRWGQRPIAWVIPADPSAQIDARGLGQHLRAELPLPAIPDLVVCCHDFPRSAIGKPNGALMASLSGKLRERLAQTIGDRPLLEGGKVDACVDMLNLSSPTTVHGAGNLKTQRDGAVSEPGNMNGDAQNLPHAHGGDKITLGMNQRHAPPFGIKDVDERITDSVEELLICLVTIAKHTPKKRDAGPVDILETYGDSMLERHDLNSREEAAR